MANIRKPVIGKPPKRAALPSLSRSLPPLRLPRPAPAPAPIVRPHPRVGSPLSVPREVAPGSDDEPKNDD